MADGSGPILGRFNFREPNYSDVFRYRLEHLQNIRLAAQDDPEVIPGLKRYYRENPVDFITDWGTTYDPRNVSRRLPALIPFLLFPRQRDWVDWVVEHWRESEPGLTEKTRDFGLSWLAVATGCTLCLFNEGMGVGYGSRKEEYVDKIGDPKSLFWKARMFMTNLPREFRGGWDLKKHASHMRIIFPETGSTMTGEAGDNIGRGDRQSIYMVDEAAYLEHPDMVDAALSQTTNCQIDISTPHGMANAFAQKRHKDGMPEDYVFVCDWRDDPRKDEAWYEKQKRELDPAILAQEVDRDYSASVEGVLIPGLWARAAIDAHVKLGISVSGERSGSLDVADEGRDLNAFCGAYGFLIELIMEWSGKGSDIFATTAKAFMICDERGYSRFRYDADGVGADVRGNARVLNESRTGATKKIVAEAFRGSGEVLDQEKKAPGTDRLNKDFFANRKAQAWWTVRMRFYKTWLMLEERKLIDAGEVKVHDAQHQYPPEEIIAISTKAGNWQKLVSELSQATYATNGVGKIVVDKTPEGAKSPNMADAVVIEMSGGKKVINISDDALAFLEGGL